MTTLIGIDLCLKIYGQEVNAGPLRDREKLESALAQPFQSFGGADLYPTLIEKVEPETRTTSAFWTTPAW